MIKLQIPTDAPTRVLSPKITLRWLHKERKSPTQAPHAEGPNLHEVPIGQSSPNELTSTQLIEKEKHIQAERAIEAKKAATAGKKVAAVSAVSKKATTASATAKEAAAAAITAEAETQNSLSQLEDDQLEQNLHNELNLELRALEMKKSSSS